MTCSARRASDFLLKNKIIFTLKIAPALSFKRTLPWKP
jgi:hypothetical protein